MAKNCSNSSNKNQSSNTSNSGGSNRSKNQNKNKSQNSSTNSNKNANDEYYLEKRNPCEIGIRIPLFYRKYLLVPRVCDVHMLTKRGLLWNLKIYH